MQMKLLKNLLNQNKLDIKFHWKHQYKVVILFLILFIYCTTKCHKINPNCGGSYIVSPNWIKNKKAPINAVYNTL